MREKYRNDPEYAERKRDRQRETKGLFQAWEKCGGVCAYCEQPLDLRDITRGPHSPVVDHVVPLSRGGKDVARNRVLSCRSCNTIKGNRTPREWLADENKRLAEAVA